MIIENFPMSPCSSFGWLGLSQFPPRAGVSLAMLL